VIFGACLHLAIQIPGLIHFGFRWTPRLDLGSPDVRRVLLLLGPRVVTMGFIQIYYIARDNFSSRFGEAAVGALNLGWFIQQVPETIIGTAIAIALLPSLAEFIARAEERAFAQTINRALRAMLALGLPLAALLIAGLRPLVGAFFPLVGIHLDPAGQELLVLCAMAFLLGLVGDTWLEVAVRAFYAQQNVRVPLLAAGGQMLGFLVLASLLSRPLGAVGVALAATLSFSTEALILLLLLNRRHPGVLRVGGTLLRAGLAAALGVILVLGGLAFLPLPMILNAPLVLVLGAAAALPLIWPEVKELVRL
jgi:putative peptidoglycan lipid II flippase